MWMGKIKKAYSLYDKAVRVIDSCITEEQIFSALRFCVLVAKRFGSVPTSTKLALTNCLDSRLDRQYKMIRRAHESGT